MPESEVKIYTTFDSFDAVPVTHIRGKNHEKRQQQGK